MSTRNDSARRRAGPATWTHSLVVVVVGALAFGCGGGSSSDGASGHAGFVASVDRVCAQAVAAHAGHPFPFLNFDPEHPDPSKLPQVADYFAKYGGLPRTTAALHRLTPPAADAAGWRKLLRIADSMTANAKRQIAAGRARDVSTFVDTVHESNQLTPEINNAGGRFGFTDQSSCGKVFG